MSPPEPGDHSPQRASDVDLDLQPADPGPRWREPHLSSLVAAVAIGGVAGAEARYGLQGSSATDSLHPLVARRSTKRQCLPRLTDGRRRHRWPCMANILGGIR